MMEELTGRYYHKKTWLGLVLMVEVKRTENVGGSYVMMDSVKRYRKATEKDLQYFGSQNLSKF